MGKSQNNNSVKSTKMNLVELRTNATPKAFTKDTTTKEYVVNARKAASLNKAKAKKKAKIAKASRRKSKK
ncbi:MAG: hypothetical protein ACNI25_08040 [Halarcobacter sp.]